MSETMASSKEKLIQAIENGELENVERLLEHFDFHSTKELHKERKRCKLETLSDHCKFDLLNRAINKKHLQIVKLLLKTGCNVFSQVIDGVPLDLFHLVIRNFDAGTVEECLRYGADANLRVLFESSALLEAVRKQDVNIVQILVKNGANVNFSTNKEGSLLEEAIKLKNYQIVEFLLNNKADVNNKYCYCRSNKKLCRCKNAPLQVAIKTKNISILKLLISHGATLPKGMNLLVYAAEWGNLAIVRYFLNQKMDINSKDKDDLSALVAAIRSGREEVVDFLLEQGADMNIECCGSPALHEAAKYGNVNIIKALLDFGVDADIESTRLYNNRTALKYACEGGFVDVVKVLLDHGANAINVDRLGRNSIVFAANGGHKQVVKALFDQGVLDISKDYMTKALERAACNGFVEVTKCLLQQGVKNFGDALNLSVQSGHCLVVDLLLNYGADVNAIGHKGSTPLQLAVTNRDEKMVRLLLDKGADVKAKSRNDLMPILHYVVFGSIDNGHKIIKILLDHGADPEASDVNGNTALHFYWQGNQILYLVKCGANFNAVNKQGHSIFHLLTSANKIKEVKTLLKTIIKLKFINNGAELSERMMEYLEEDDVLRVFYDRCEDEILQMKEEYIEETGISVYEIFNAKTMGLLGSLANIDAVVEYFDSRNFRSRFPLYSAMLKAHVKKGLLRQKYFDEIHTLFFHSLLGKSTQRLPELTIGLTDRILNYLTYKDLVNLREASQY